MTERSPRLSHVCTPCELPANIADEENGRLCVTSYNHRDELDGILKDIH